LEKTTGAEEGQKKSIVIWIIRRESVEKVVSFVNDAWKMYGIVHIPDAIPATFSQRIGVVILHAGRQARRGPHKLYVKIARALCQQGFYVLRYDNRGYGDSEGSENLTMYDWFSDASCAMGFFMESLALDKLILWGQCGGSVLAIHYASQNPSVVDSLILCNLMYKPGQTVFRGQFKATYRKLLDFSFWRKFLFTSPVFYFKKSAPHVKRFFLKAFFPDQFDKSLEESAIKYVKSLPYSFSRAARPTLFIFSTSDPLVGDVEEELFGDPLWRKHLDGIPTELSIIEGADHNFSSVNYEWSAIDKTVTWAMSRAVNS
jgi:pimeloyl-ACP methyl ester carboxylesterase